MSGSPKLFLYFNSIWFSIQQLNLYSTGPQGSEQKDKPQFAFAESMGGPCLSTSQHQFPLHDLTI